MLKPNTQYLCMINKFERKTINFQHSRLRLICFETYLEGLTFAGFKLRLLFSIHWLNESRVTCLHLAWIRVQAVFCCCQIFHIFPTTYAIRFFVNVPDVIYTETSHAYVDHAVEIVYQSRTDMLFRCFEIRKSKKMAVANLWDIGVIFNVSTFWVAVSVWNVEINGAVIRVLVLARIKYAPCWRIEWVPWNNSKRKLS